jgi:hypothetical protein
MNRGDCGEYRQAAEAVAQRRHALRGRNPGSDLHRHDDRDGHLCTRIRLPRSGGIGGARGRAKLLSGPVARVYPAATARPPKKRALNQTRTGSRTNNRD